MLNIRKLDVHYGPLAALQEISLEVKKGEFVSLLGPNGAGKTTLLLTISGILKTTEGRILFEEQDVTNLDPHKIVSLGIGHVPQGRHTFPTLSVIDNLMLGRYVQRKTKKDLKEDFEWIYQLFPILKERSHQRAGTLSGGEQQMLTIARAMVGRPKLLMLDEPSTGLASHLKDEIFSAFKAMNQKGLTLFIIEQEIYLSLTISHRGYLLRNGRLIKEGAASSLLVSNDVKALFLGPELDMA